MKTTILSNQKGFSLIEVLIAIGILAVFLLGIAELQIAALQSNHQAFMQTIATEQLKSMASIVQLSGGSSSKFYKLWNIENKALLPQGYGELQKEGGQSVIRLRWWVGVSHRWHCSSKPLNKFACVEIKVSV